MKTLIKLLVAAAIVYASWQCGNAYLKFYRLKDAAQDVDPDKIAVRRTPNHTYVTTSYVEKIEVLPSFFYPWEFKLDIDVLTMTPPRDAQLPDK